MFLRNLALAFVVLGSLGLAVEDSAPQFDAIDNRQSTLADGPDAVTIPRMLSYQGKLTDTLGIPVADTLHVVRFRLYAQPTGGTQFWEENQQVRTKAGLFSVLLGSVTPIGSMPDAGAVYLGMAVEGGAELTPRLRIASAAYAYLTERAANSDLLQGRDTTTFSRSTHNHDAAYVNEGQASSVTSTMITDATVAAADLNQMGASSGQVMKWTGSAWAPRNDSVGGGGTGDNAWVRVGGDSVLYTVRQLGIARGGSGNVLYGINAQTHANFGTECTTGVSGGNLSQCVVGGGRRNAATGDQSGVASGYANKARGLSAFVGGGFSNIAQSNHATVAGGSANLAFACGAGVGSGYSNVAGLMVADTAAAVAGGRLNRAGGMYSFVGGGWSNATSGQAATVAGGAYDSAVGYFSTVAGGMNNTTGADFATVAGGNYNDATGQFSSVGGGNFNDATGQFAVVGGGDYNLASGVGSVVAGGRGDTAVAPYSAVMSGFRNKVGYMGSESASVIVGGCNNRIDGRYTFIGGGCNNGSLASHAAIAGGDSNSLEFGNFGFIGGGLHNTVDGGIGTIAGGWYNDVEELASYGAIGGGARNRIDDGKWSTIAGGDSNSINGDGCVIAGGGHNWIGEWIDYSSVGGGYADTVRAERGVIGGGYSNLAGDAADDTATVIAGGWDNAATGKFNFVGGGYQNNASNNYAVIAGGRGNVVNGPQAAVGGGWGNTASGWHSAIPGGFSNSTYATASAVVGGQQNSVSTTGEWSTVAGGRYDTIAGSCAQAAGYNVRVRDAADYTLAFGENCSTSTPRAVVFYHSGAATRLGVGVQNPAYNIHVQGGAYCNGTNWVNGSSRKLKTDIRALTAEQTQAVLEELQLTQVVNYRYKSEASGEQHIGLIAEDAPELLATPERDGINTADAIGFLLAVAKAQQAEIEALKAALAGRE